MAGDALRALAVSVTAHGAAERSRSGSQPLKGSPQAPPGIPCGSQQQVGRDRPCPPSLSRVSLSISAITHLLPKPAGRQQRAPGGEPPALLPHSPSLPGPREGTEGAANNASTPRHCPGRALAPRAAPAGRAPRGTKCKSGLPTPHHCSRVQLPPAGTDTAVSSPIHHRRTCVRR